jgi:hypothetical protein
MWNVMYFRLMYSKWDQNIEIKKRDNNFKILH